MDPLDAGALDLSIVAPGSGTAEEFMALMDRAIERIKEERGHPQYLVFRTEEEAAWFFGKWGPSPDAA